MLLSGLLALPLGYGAASVLLGDWLARHDRETDTFAGSAPPGLPPRVAAFGTIHVSPDVLHLLAVVGQWSELDFYLPTPSAEYWGDVDRIEEWLPFFNHRLHGQFYIFFNLSCHISCPNLDSIRTRTAISFKIVRRYDKLFFLI